uniref:Uncharacterized protein n=1 Tax=Arion vulgaris TaxID=1028688 RepID=A0A0B7ATX6_9EUPU
MLVFVNHYSRSLERRIGVTRRCCLPGIWLSLVRLGSLLGPGKAGNIDFLWFRRLVIWVDDSTNEIVQHS